MIKQGESVMAEVYGPLRRHHPYEGPQGLRRRVRLARAFMFARPALASGLCMTRTTARVAASGII